MCSEGANPASKNNAYTTLSLYPLFLLHEKHGLLSMAVLLFVRTPPSVR